jgi:predicted nucleotidyltransferase
MWGNLQKTLKQETKLDLKTSRKTKVYSHIKSPLLRHFIKNKYVMLASNWVFQGFLMKTWGERSFQIMADLVFALPAFILLSFLLRQVPAAILAVIIAHTLTWTFNGNLWSLPKFAGATYDTARNIKFMVNLEKRGRNTFGSVAAIAAFGSLSRGEFSRASDIDIRVIRNPGILNWVKANTFSLYLRSIAFIKKIPLDLFVLDNVNQIGYQMRLDEPPIVIYDPTNALSEIGGYTIPLREVVQRYQNRQT